MRVQNNHERGRPDDDKKRNTRDERYVRPKMAEEKFKLAQGLQQNVYLYGITGIGKTAFVKDMLGRKSYDYYSAKEGSAEQILLPEDDKVHIIVIDDLHHIMDDRSREEYVDRLHVLMQRRNIWLILIARCTFLVADVLSCRPGISDHTGKGFISGSTWSGCLL